MKIKAILGLLCSTALIVYLIFFGTKTPGEITPIFSPQRDSTPKAKGEEILIGVKKGDDDYWNVLKKLAKEKDIIIKVVQYKDTTQLNNMVNEGTLHINCFQTVEEFNTAKAQNNLNLEILTKTTADPYKFYSEEKADVRELTPGAVIALPPTPEECAKALFTINKAGIITLTEGATMPTPQDVLMNPLKLQFVSAPEDELKDIYKEWGLACGNSSFKDKLKVSNDANVLYTEHVKGEDYLYAQVAVVKSGESHKYAEIVKMLKSLEVREAIKSQYKGRRVAAF